MNQFIRRIRIGRVASPATRQGSSAAWLVAGAVVLGILALGGIWYALKLDGPFGTGQPPLAPVIGTVSLNGEPLADGTIFFQPTDQRWPESMGVIKNGEFSMLTDVQGDLLEGAIVGDHRVRIEAAGDVIPGAGPVWLTPEKYRTFAKSGLTATVVNDHNECSFEMKGDPGGLDAPAPKGKEDNRPKRDNAARPSGADSSEDESKTDGDAADGTGAEPSQPSDASQGG